MRETVSYMHLKEIVLQRFKNKEFLEVVFMVYQCADYRKEICI